MEEITAFNNQEFGEVRTAVVNGEPMFCLVDVCRALEIKNSRNCKARLNGKGVDSIDTLTNGGRQSMIYVDESNLYKAIFRSRKESAERFTDWVTSEVIPSIRKNGGYIAGQEELTDDELLSKALIVAQNKIKERDKAIEQKQRRIEEMRPKEVFADAVLSSGQSILIGELAKLISQSGRHIGQNQLFKWMRDNKYLNKSGSSYNMPAQRYIEQGLFEVAERPIKNPDGSIRVTFTTKVTGKGQIYFINKLLEE